MTDASYLGSAYAVPRARAKAEPLRQPAPQPLAAPVFIHDCVTPVAGETLLSLLMKRMMHDAGRPDDDPT
ncbi:MAG: hypothetical protein HKP51_02025 [Sulfitobacter sp.]|nr:hypothetical protein [Sulfitobacter sp.]